MEDALKGFQAQLMELYRTLDDEFDDATTEYQASVIVELHALLTEYKMVIKEFEDRLMKFMRLGDSIEVAGGSVEKTESAPRKTWQHDRLADTVLHRLKDMSISDDGEVLLTPDEAVTRLLQFAHVDYWRAKELRTLGINPDAFSERSDPKDKISIRKAN